MNVRVLGGPIPYREALSAALIRSGFKAAETDSTTACELIGESGLNDGVTDAAIIYAGTDEMWNEVFDVAPHLPTVAVLPELKIESYVRALSCGAGAVYYDTSPSTMVDVMVATVRGESLLPAAVTMALANHVPPTTEDILAEQLTPMEEEIAGRLVDGATVQQIAEQLNYSDRTVRRRIKGIYLKIGASSRADAIALLRQRA